jgi:hypothetical protein
MRYAVRLGFYHIRCPFLSSNIDTTQETVYFINDRYKTHPRRADSVNSSPAEPKANSKENAGGRFPLGSALLQAGFCALWLVRTPRD